MRFLQNSLLLLFLVLNGLTGTAQSNFKPVTGEPLASLKTQIKNKNALINTLICPFTQVKQMTILKNPSTSKGIMYFKKPEQFRWEYTQNPKFIFAQNGKTIYTKSGDQVQIVKDNSAMLYQEISKLVVQSINGSILENSKDFSPIFEENQEVIKITLIPKQRNLKKFIASIHLFIDKNTYIAHQFILNEPNGDFTKITFENVTVNQNINNAQFILK